jgi:hypothetical protein
MLSRRRCLVLVMAGLVAAMMLGHAVPALAQTNKADEEKVVAQAEKKNPEEKVKPEEKGNPEEKGTTKGESARAPSTVSILLGIIIGALLVGGGLLARARATSVGPASSEEAASFVDVVRRVVIRPVEFFASLPRGGNLLNPLLFALICTEISAVLGWLLVLFGVGSEPGVNPNPQNLGLPSILTPGSPVVSVILALIGGAIGIFLASIIQQLLVRLIVGARNSGYAATFRVASYTQVTSLVNWVPIVGPLLALYGIYLSIVGIREMHGTTMGKAALVVLIPFAVVLVVVLVILLAVGAMSLFQR